MAAAHPLRQFADLLVAFLADDADARTRLLDLAVPAAETVILYNCAATVVLAHLYRNHAHQRGSKFLLGMLDDPFTQSVFGATAVHVVCTIIQDASEEVMDRAGELAIKAVRRLLGYHDEA